MSIVSSGAITLGGNTVTVPGKVTSSVEFELYENGKGYSSTGTSQIGMNDSAVRGLAGIASGQISMGNLYSKSAFTPGSQTFTANGTYTVPWGYTTLTIEVWGAGGAGGAGSAGGNSSVSGTGLTTMTAYGGSAGSIGNLGSSGAGGVGGTAVGGTTLNTTGATGITGGAGATGTTGSIAGGTGGAHAATAYQPAAGIQGGTGGAPGAGGGGGSYQTSGMAMCGCGGYLNDAGGGGAGGYSKSVITTGLSLGTVLTVSVGTGGVGTAGNQYGGNGGDGRVIITYA